MTQTGAALRRREHYWCLYDVTEKNQLNDLRTDQVEAIFAALPEKQKAQWLLWKEGFSGWKSFTEFPQLLLSLRQVSAPQSDPPPVPQMKAGSIASVAFGDDLEDIDLSISNETAEEVRENVRYQKRFEVRIVGTDKIYSNATVNISMKGMQLEKPLSGVLPRYFTVEVRGARESVSLICSQVPSRDGSPSQRLKIEVNDYPSRLQTILLAS